MRAGLLLVIVLPLGLLAAGCGGGSKNPSVASLGPATTQATTTTPSPGKGGNQTGDFVKFAHCMNAHGVPVQVQSGGAGKVGISIGSTGLKPGSPQLQHAQTACQKYLPGGGPPNLTPAQKAQMRQGELAIAQCMRKHGYPNFPDPDSQGVLDLTNVDPQSPQFQSAMQACRPAGGKSNIMIRARVGGP
jgi:hypothetical protein